MEVRALSADLEAIALQELNEDRDRIEEDLKHIRDWLSKQPHLTARTGNNHSIFNYGFFYFARYTSETNHESQNLGNAETVGRVVSQETVYVRQKSYRRSHFNTC
jgi:hypothetical protein